MNKKLLFLFIVSIFIIALYQTATNPLPKKTTNIEEKPKQRYEPTWTDGSTLEISKVLAKNKITSCGQMKRKASMLHKNEYLLYCTRDGDNWQSYIVFTKAQNIIGPYNTDPKYD